MKIERFNLIFWTIQLTASQLSTIAKACGIEEGDISPSSVVAPFRSDDNRLQGALDLLREWGYRERRPGEPRNPRDRSTFKIIPFPAPRPPGPPLEEVRFVLPKIIPGGRWGGAWGEEELSARGLDRDENGLLRVFEHIYPHYSDQHLIHLGVSANSFLVSELLHDRILNEVDADAVFKPTQLMLRTGYKKPNLYRDWSDRPDWEPFWEWVPNATLPRMHPGVEVQWQIHQCRGYQTKNHRVVHENEGPYAADGRHYLRADVEPLLGLSLLQTEEYNTPGEKGRELLISQGVYQILRHDGLYPADDPAWDTWLPMILHDL